MRKGYRNPILVDTDAGIDDIAAILQLARNGIHFVGITVVATGLCPPGAAGLNLLRLMLYLKNMTTQIAVGQDKVFGTVQHQFPFEVRSSVAQMFNGEPFDTLLPTPTAADKQRLFYDPVALIKNSVKQQGALTILALGPLTNIALFFHEYPEYIRCVNIVSMGGVFSVPGNIRDFDPGNLIRAEWNYYADPAAVGFLFKRMAHRILIVPLDATIQVPFTEAFFDKIRNSPNDDIQLISACFKPIIDQFGLAVFLESFFLWDQLAAMVATNRLPYHINSQRCVIDPKTSVFTQDPSGVNLHYVDWVDAKTARSAFLHDLCAVSDVTIKKISAAL